MSPKRLAPVFLATLALTLLARGEPPTAAIIVPVQDQSQVDVSVESDVQFDAAAGLYTYGFVVTNGPAAPQEVQTFVVGADAEILNVQSPEGWDGLTVSQKPRLAWFAIGFLDNTIPPEEDDGNVFPSDFNIKPGQSLGGFSFQSPEGPRAVTFFAQGFAKAPQADSEDDFDDTVFPTFEENSFEGTTIGAGLDDGIVFAGGRRPSVDGFLGFIGVEDRATLAAPVALVIRFAVNGETVDVSTFSAQLNRVDVTGLFQPTGNSDEMLALFDLAVSPLVVGRNVLNTSVEGIVPGTTRTAADGDAFTFFVP